jgi:iron complex transport system permease protein
LPTLAARSDSVSNTRCRPERLLVRLTILLVGIFILSLFLGRYPSPGFTSVSILANDELAQRLVWELRLPRLLTALLLGVSLSAAGEVFQMILANPLVEPGFLGVSQGAAFGAALSIIFLSTSPWAIQIMAALFGFLGLTFSYFLAHRIRMGRWILRLVLAGIAVSALFSSGVGVLKYLADPLSELQEITYWLLGGLWSITWAQLRAILPVVLPSLWVMHRMRWRLNLLSLRDEISFSLGLKPERERALLLVAAVAATASIVSVSGMVGWIGLIMPHLSRRLFGANARFAMPGSMLIGGIFAILCDDLARTLMVGEIPLGILTSLIGAIFFISLMLTKNLGLR